MVNKVALLIASAALCATSSFALPLSERKRDLEWAEFGKRDTNGLKLGVEARDSAGYGTYGAREAAMYPPSNNLAASQSAIPSPIGDTKDASKYPSANNLVAPPGATPSLATSTDNHNGSKEKNPNDNHHHHRHHHHQTHKGKSDYQADKYAHNTASKGKATAQPTPYLVAAPQASASATATPYVGTPTANGAKPPAKRDVDGSVARNKHKTKRHRHPKKTTMVPQPSAPVLAKYPGEGLSVAATSVAVGADIKASAAPTPSLAAAVAMYRRDDWEEHVLDELD